MSDRPTACPGCYHANHRGHCTAPNPCGCLHRDGLPPVRVWRAGQLHIEPRETR